MRVRTATPADAAEACTIIRRSITELCVIDHESDEHLAKWLSNKSPENVLRWMTTNYYVVAEEDGALLGVAGMNDTGKIVVNYVSPDPRFRGVSKAMMQHLEDRAVALGLSECFLETNKTAPRFYLAICASADGHSGRRPQEDAAKLTSTPLTLHRWIASAAIWLFAWRDSILATNVERPQPDMC